MSGEVFRCPDPVGVGSVMLLNVLQHTGRPTTKDSLAPNVSSAEVENLPAISWRIDVSSKAQLDSR